MAARTPRAAILAHDSSIPAVARLYLVRVVKRPEQTIAPRPASVAPLVPCSCIRPRVKRKPNATPRALVYSSRTGRSRRCLYPVCRRDKGSQQPHASGYPRTTAREQDKPCHARPVPLVNSSPRRHPWTARPLCVPCTLLAPRPICYDRFSVRLVCCALFYWRVTATPCRRPCGKVASPTVDMLIKSF